MVRGQPPHQKNFFSNFLESIEKVEIPKWAWSGVTPPPKKLFFNFFESFENVRNAKWAWPGVIPRGRKCQLPESSRNVEKTKVGVVKGPPDDDLENFFSR